MAGKLKIRKGKKQWFAVAAPEVYNGIDIGEITAYEPEELIGRKVALTLARITGNPKDSQKNIEFKISEVKGTKAFTVPWKYFSQAGFVQRLGKRYRSRFIVVLRTATKDELTIKIKLYALTQGKVTNRAKASIINQLTASTKAMVSQYKLYDLFVPGNFDKISNELKKDITKIYPASKVMVWKATVWKTETK